jgi:methylglutaconyl-CoA hydratase
VEKLVDSLLQNGPEAVRASKKLVVDVAGRDITAELIEDTCGRIAQIRISQEGQEGLGAFLNKRKPNWLGE